MQAKARTDLNHYQTGGNSEKPKSNQEIDQSALSQTLECIMKEISDLPGKY